MKKSLLIGNGININFGGKAYSNQFIIKRIIFNARAGKYDALFEGTITGDEIARVFESLAENANDIAEGEYDTVIKDDERHILEDFKRRYSKKVEHYYDVGLEDWLFILHAFFLKNSDIKGNWAASRQGLERMMLDAIYNDGDLQNVYTTMGKPVKRWLEEFNKIFTLNYDNNIERLTKKQVLHLHGDYCTLANSENTGTVLGYLREKRGQRVVLEGFEHCFCDALFDYEGENKLRTAENFEISKEAFKRVADSSASLSELPTELADLVQTYREHPELEIAPDYHFSDFENLNGELHIIGMSPNNDGHIFKLIDKSAVDKVVFYFYSESEKKQKLPIHQRVEYKSAAELWKKLRANQPRYNNRYLVPDADRLVKIGNLLSEDEVSKEEAIKEVNSIPEFRSKELCALVEQKVMDLKENGAPSSEEEQRQRFREISRIGLRNGVLPVALYIHYILKLGK